MGCRALDAHFGVPDVMAFPLLHRTVVLICTPPIIILARAAESEPLLLAFSSSLPQHFDSYKLRRITGARRSIVRAGLPRAAGHPRHWAGTGAPLAFLPPWSVGTRLKSPVLEYL